MQIIIGMCISLRIYFLSSVHTCDCANGIISHQQSNNGRALAVALEACRNENAALKLAYQYSMEKYHETKAAYDSLLNQLKEEGAMLSKRDRERFHNCLKDLKDYEIYKQVMEAAMVRLQSDVESYAAENAALKENRYTSAVYLYLVFASVGE
jgi:hypothetical protein